MARETYVVINVDKRSNPVSYRVQIVKNMPDGKRKSVLHKSFRGVGAKTKAKEEKAKLEAEILSGNMGVINTELSVEDFFKEYNETTSKLKEWSEKYFHSNEYKSREFIKFCHRKRINMLSEIQLVHIEMFIGQITGKVRTRNAYISYLKTAFSKAIDREYIYKDPTRKLKKQKEKDKQSTRPFSDEQVKTIFEFVKKRFQWMIPILKLAFYTGMRRSELCSLKWEMIDMLKDKIILPASLTKGKYDRVFPIPLVIKKLFLSMERFEDGYVFRNSDGKPLLADNLSHVFTKVMKSLNYGNGYSIHSTRATFITKGLQTGDTIAVQAIVGHKDLSTTQGYTEAFEDAKKRVIDAINYSE